MFFLGAAGNDITAIGKDAAPEALRPTLVSFPDMGHAPRMQDPAAFHRELPTGLKAGR